LDGSFGFLAVLNGYDEFKEVSTGEVKYLEIT
jgi:predicted phosphoribosyltransferase